MAEALPCTRAKGLTGRWLALSVLLLIGLGHPTFFSGQAQKPKPLTPARQNNVIATAAPPATDATESSRKTILLLSDASGRTASGLLAGVLAQFEVIGDGIEVQTATEVTTRERLQEVIEAIKGRGGSVLVLATLVDSTLSGWAKTFCADYNLQFVEVMGPLLDRMGGFLEQRSRGEPGASLSERAIKRILNKDFFGMVEAVKYSQRHIGGLNSQDWHEADIILVGPSRCGKGPVAHQLAMRGFKVNELDHWGASALHHSARQGHEAVLKLLVHHQADISAMTSRMQTPADLARKHGHPSLAAILEQEVLQRAEVSKKQKKGACWTWFTSFGAVAVVLFASRFIHCNSETVF